MYKTFLFLIIPSFILSIFLFGLPNKNEHVIYRGGKFNIGENINSAGDINTLRGKLFKILVPDIIKISENNAIYNLCILNKNIINEEKIYYGEAGQINISIFNDGRKVDEINASIGEQVCDTIFFHNKLSIEVGVKDQLLDSNGNIINTISVDTKDSQIYTKNDFIYWFYRFIKTYLTLIVLYIALIELLKKLKSNQKINH